MIVLRISLFIILAASAASSQWTMGPSTPVAPPPPPPQTSFWTGILDPTRAAVWTYAGVHDVNGVSGIPKYPPCTKLFEFPVTGSGIWLNPSNLQPTGVTHWDGDHQYNAGDRVADFAGNVEIAQNSGMSRPWHPLWPTIAGGTIIDSSVTWVMSLGAPPAGTRGWARFANYKIGDVIIDSNGNTETVTKAGTTAVRYVPAFPPSTPVSENELTCDASGDDIKATYGVNPDPADPVACPGLKWQRKRSGTDTALINAALFACNGTSTAVQLAAGNFDITYGVSFNPAPPTSTSYLQNTSYNHVVLRGAGPKVTKLISWNRGVCNTGTICINGTTAGAGGYGGPTGSGTSFGAAAMWLGTDGLEGTYHQHSKMLVFGPWISCDTGNCAGVVQKYPQPGDVLNLDQRSDVVGICPETVPSPAYKCTAVGAHEDGNTVTITTTVDHGVHVGDCVAVVSVGPTRAGAINVTSNLRYNTSNALNRVNCDATNDTIPSARALGWFKVTAVPTTNSFQYTLPVSGLPDSGWGWVARDDGGTAFYSDMRGISSEQNALGLSTTGRMCPKDASNRTPGDHCEPGELGQRAQSEGQMVTRVIPGGTENCPAADTCYDVEPGIGYPNWTASKRPGAWFVQSSFTATYLGMEDLTVDNLDDGSGISVGGNTNGAIKMTNGINCWFKNLRILYIPRSAIWIIGSSFNTVAETYIYGSKGLMSTAYGFEQHSGSSYNLLINNICQRVNGCYMNNMGMGSVEAYGFNISAPFRGYGFTADQSGPWRPMIGMNHQSMHMLLVEGMVTPGVAADDIHGSGNASTVFRNRLISNDYPRKCLNPSAVQFSGYQRAYNMIGNIIGEPQDSLCTAQFYAGVNLGRVSGFYSMGGSMSTTSKCCYWQDKGVWDLQMRWGNYDTVTAAQPNSGNGVRWCGDPAFAGRTTICQGIVSATYAGGQINTNNASGWQTLGLWCTVRFPGNGNGQAFGIFNIPPGFTQNSEIAVGTPIQMEDQGMNYTGSVTTGQPSTGFSTVCQGTTGGVVQVNAVVGPVSEFPTVGRGFLAANPVPATHDLPPSFFLSTRPDFFTTTWGTLPWPIIGPDVTSSGPFDASCPRVSQDFTGMGSPSGCNGVAHMGYMNPAQICFNHLPMDMYYQETRTITHASWTTGPTFPNPPINDPADTQGLVTLTLDQPIVLHKADGIIVSGVNPQTYNGQFLVWDQGYTLIGEESSNLVRYGGLFKVNASFPNAIGDPGNYVGGGTMTVPNIRLYDARDCYPDSNYAVK